MRTSNLSLPLPFGVMIVITVLSMGIGVLAGTASFVTAVLGGIVLLICLFAAIPPATWTWLLICVLPLLTPPIFRIPLDRRFYNIYVSHVVFAGLLVSWGLRLSRQRVGRFVFGAGIGRGLIALSLAEVLSALGVVTLGGTFAAYLLTFAQYLMFISLFIIIVTVLDSEHLVFRAIRILIVSSILVAIYGIYTFVSVYVPALPVIPGTEPVEYLGISRLHSVVQEPAIFPAYMLGPLGFQFTFLVLGIPFPFKRMWLNLVGAIVMILSFVLAFSFTGYVGLVSTFFFLVALSPILWSKPGKHLISSSRRSFGRLVGFAGLSTILIAVTLVLLPQIQEPLIDRMLTIADLRDASLRYRLHNFGLALDYLAMSPVVGLGAGNFKVWAADLVVFTKYVFWADSNALTLLSETGFIGVIALVLFYGSLLRGLWGSWLTTRMRKEEGVVQALPIAFLVVLLTELVVNFFLTGGGGWLSFRTWFLLGLVAAWIVTVRHRVALSSG